MSKKIIAFLVLFVIILLYKNWIFIGGVLSSGDWPYLFKETIKSFSFTPDPQFLWLGPYYQITSKLFVEYLNIPWIIYERVFWFWMFLAISFSSSLYLSRAVLKDFSLRILTTLIFMTNTYILMVVGGGQMGVALSYAFAPVVLGLFLQLVDTSTRVGNSKFILFGILYGLHIMFDPRISYVTTIGLLLYLILEFYLKKNKKELLNKGYHFGLAIVIALIINLPWVLTRLLAKQSNFFIEASTESKGFLEFFSFGSYSQAFSLLHPNWPENIFGKTYFLYPEFLILPIIAFAGLLFVNKRIIFFGLLGLLGIFLSKGTNEPFGQIYEFLYSYVPGFIFFRDPTKFYLLIVLSYSILIPFSLEKISDKIQNSRFAAWKTGIIKNVVLILFLVFWTLLIKEAFVGQLSGTFKTHPVPVEYVQLKDYLYNDKKFSKTLWVPNRQNFTFYSSTHPFIEATSVLGNLTNSSNVSSAFSNKKTKTFLKREQIAYVIVPQDSEGKIFINDRKYSEKNYQSVVQALKQVPYLVFKHNFGKIVVFEVQL